MANEAFSLKSASVWWAGWATVTYGRVGKLKTRVGKRTKVFRRFAPNFAHPGLKPCRRPWAVGRIRAGKAPGACGIYPEYIRYGGHTALSALNELFVEVWEQEAVPDEWRQGIIIPQYKGKVSRSECSNYRVITLLSAAGKVFAHLLLARIKPTLLSHKWIGFTEWIYL